MSVNVTGEGPWGPGSGGVLGKSPPLYDRPVRGVGVGVWATPLTEHATKMIDSNERRRRSSLRNLRVLCVSAVKLMAAQLTAETPKSQRARGVLFPTDSEGGHTLDLLDFLGLINQLIIPFVRDTGVLSNLRRIVMPQVNRIRFRPQMREHVMPAA